MLNSIQEVRRALLQGDMQSVVEAYAVFREEALEDRGGEAYARLQSGIRGAYSKFEADAIKKYFFDTLDMFLHIRTDERLKGNPEEYRKKLLDAVMETIRETQELYAQTEICESSNPIKYFILHLMLDIICYNQVPQKKVMYCAIINDIIYVMSQEELPIKQFYGNEVIADIVEYSLYIIKKFCEFNVGGGRHSGVGD